MAANPPIQVIGLRKAFGAHVVLDDVSLEVRPGEAVALVGPNGAGKTTVLRILATLLGPSRGTARVAGYDCAQETERVRAHVGLLARGQVARRAPRRIQGSGRRDPHDHAQLRSRTGRGRPDRDPDRRTPRVRRSPPRAHARRRAAPLRAARGERGMTYARRTWIVLWKDLLSERRSKETLNALFFFALLLLFLFQFALGADRERLTAALPGLLWLGFILSGLVGLGRAFLVERENDCWEGLLLVPGDKSAIYLGKVAGNLILMLLVEAILLVLFAVFFDIDLGAHPIRLIVVIGLGTLGFAAVGTLFAAMTAHVRAREVLFPVLLPVQVPVLLGAVKATEAVLLGEPLGAVGHWLGLLAAADTIYLTVGVLTFDAILEA